jgi:carbonic anhydrase
MAQLVIVDAHQRNVLRHKAVPEDLRTRGKRDLRFPPSYSEQQMDRRQLLKGLTGLALCPFCATPGFAQEHWDYSNPAAWPGACSTGTAQSPIDIVKASRANLPPLKIAWPASADTIVNNGHTIQLNFKSGGLLAVGNNKFTPLNQFHFHRPSEHKIGGKGFAMEVHFVHNYPDRTAVIGVLMVAGKPNPAFSHIVKSMPKKPEHGAKAHEVPVKGVNPQALLPASHGYFRYAGSLTTPGCAEGVEWMLMDHPIEVAAADIAAFAKMYPNNARPARRDGREVQRSS